MREQKWLLRIIVVCVVASFVMLAEIYIAHMNRQRLNNAMLEGLGKGLQKAFAD